MANDLVFLAARLGTPLRLSAAAQGGGNAASGSARFTADGASITFESLASNFGPFDDNGRSDIYRHDLATGAITRVSLAADGTRVGGSSFNARPGPGGVIAFDSDAADLVPRDTNERRDVFVKDLATGAVTLVSTNAAGIAGNADSFMATLSPDGTRVVFESLATNLTGFDGNGARDVFIKNLATGAISRASQTAAGGELAGQSGGASFSPDGTRLLFESNAPNLVGGDTNGRYDLFIRDLATGHVTRVSTDAVGGQSDGHSFNASFTADGAAILFESLATDLVAGDTNGVRDIFLKDLATGSVSRVSTSAAGTQANGSAYAASASGRWLAFETGATNLVAGDTNLRRDIVLKDLATGTVTRVLGAGGAQADADLFNPRLSADGTMLLFESAASNLVAGDGNGARDVFVARIEAADTAAAAREDGPAVTGRLFFDDADALAAHTVAVRAEPGALGTLTAAIVAPAAGAGAGEIGWSYTGGAELDALRGGETREARFAVLLTSPTATVETSLTITITGVNDAPVAAADTLTIDAGGVSANLYARLLANDHDPDAGDTLVIVAVETDGLAGALAFDAAHAQLVYRPDAGAQAQMLQGEHRVERFHYIVRDAAGATARTSVDVRVEGTALPPAGPTEGDDLLFGTAFADVLEGLGGDDELRGFDGDDRLDGGEGADTLAGGAGDDRYLVDDPFDLVIEAMDEGFDIVETRLSRFVLPHNVEEVRFTGSRMGSVEGIGNADTNIIVGRDGHDRLYGMAGDDDLLGGGGNDRLDGGAGADYLVGGAGNDTYTVDTPGDLAIELFGGGVDTIVASVGYELPFNVELLRLVGGDLDGMGNDDPNTLYGTAGANLLDGGRGADRLEGGSGDDRYVVDDALDLVVEGAGGGFDTVESRLSVFTLADGVEALRFIGSRSGSVQGTGNAGSNHIVGRDGHDRLYGMAGDDHLVGGVGSDRLDGGLGADLLEGGAGNDVFIFRKGEAHGDTVLDFLGNGTATGDTLRLDGWGAGTRAHAAAGELTVVDGLDGSVAVLRVVGAIHASDILFG